MNMLIENLAPFHIFHGLDEEDAQAICSDFRTQTYSANTRILTEGESVQCLWIILSGEAEVFRKCDAHDSHILARLKAGDVFGEMSFLNTAPHSATVRSTTPLTAGCYRRQDFLALAERRPAAGFRVATNLAAVLSERLRRMDDWICELMNSPDGRHRRDEWKSFRSAVYTNWDF